MAKKIEVDIDYLKSIGLSKKQISDIIKNSEPDHWSNSLPQNNLSWELLPFMISPESRLKERVTIYCANQHDPMLSFFTQDDAQFIQNKCQLLIEMSNFSFAVNDDWCPDWNNKDEKKYGIVLQNGQARVSENELFNLYVFGIVTKTRVFAFEMLEEFKERIETYFNKNFNSNSERVNIIPTSGILGGTNHTAGLGIMSTISNTDSNPDFFSSIEPKQENISKRKKRKVLKNDDVEKIRNLLLNNVPQKEIAMEFDCSEGAISALKDKLGFKMRKRQLKH